MNDVLAVASYAVQLAQLITALVLLLLEFHNLE